MMVTLFAVSCTNSSVSYDSEKDAVVETEFADLVQIPGYDYLYYSITERTVYYLFTNYDKGFFGPYIMNGHTCEYVEGKIIEVIPTVRIEEITG